jgi:hypothetical protein
MLLGFTIALLGLTIQSCVLIDTLSARGYGLAIVFLKLVSYFTILTNLLVAGSHGLALIAPRSRIARRIGSASFGSALFLYIILVGSLYAFLLAPFWHPHGWQWLANAILHYATPVLYACFWFFCVPKALLPWKLALVWLAYPGVYLLWVLGRGAVLGDYPYFFMNPVALGYGRLSLYAAGLALVFLAAGFAVIAGNRLLHRSSLKLRIAQDG